MQMRRFGMIAGAGAVVHTLVFAGGGCASVDRIDHTMVLGQREDARSVEILRGDGTGPVSWDEVAREMAGADVVLFGEVHNHELGNAVAQELFEDVLMYNPRSVLSMEFFERDDQVAVDDYLSGVTDLEGFTKAADRSETNYPYAHRRMVDAAKEAGRPVIASNAARRYVKIARTDGFDRLRSLGEAQQRMFVVPDGIAEGAYKDRFVEAMGGMASHGGEDMINGFLRSQSVWDATMGQSIVDGLGEGSPIAHVVGFFHVQFGSEPGGSGLIDEIRARAMKDLGRDVKIVTLITIPAAHDVLEDEDMGIAEFVVYVGDRE